MGNYIVFVTFSAGTVISMQLERNSKKVTAAGEIELGKYRGKDMTFFFKDHFIRGHGTTISVG